MDAGQRRRHPPDDAARTARPSGAVLQHPRAALRSARRCRLHHHGADGIPADVGLQHHLRGHRAAGNRHPADARTTDRADAGNPRRAGRGARHLPRRQGHAGGIPQCSRLRGASRRADRGRRSRPRHRRRGLGRDVLRAGRGRAAGGVAGCRQRQGDRACLRGGPPRRRRTAPRRPPGQPGDHRPHHHRSLGASGGAGHPRARRDHAVDPAVRSRPPRPRQRHSRPFALRHGDLRQDGGAARAGGTAGRAGVRQRRSARHAFHRAHRRGNPRRPLPRHRTDAGRPGLDPRYRELDAGPLRSVPGGLYRRRLGGLRRLSPPLSAAPRSAPACRFPGSPGRPPAPRPRWSPPWCAG